MTDTSKRMQWRSLDGADTEKVLHLEMGGVFKPYNTTTLGATLERLGQVGLPEGVKTLNYSKGWHCYQALLRQGWTLIPSPGVEATISPSLRKSENKPLLSLEKQFELHTFPDVVAQMSETQAKQALVDLHKLFVLRSALMSRL